MNPHISICLVNAIVLNYLHMSSLCLGKGAGIEATLTAPIPDNSKLKALLAEVVSFAGARH